MPSVLVIARWSNKHVCNKMHVTYCTVQRKIRQKSRFHHATLCCSAVSATALCPVSISVRPSVCVLSDTIRCYRETAARITVQSTQMTEPIEMPFGLWEGPNSQGTMYKLGPDHPLTGRSTFWGHTYRFARSRYSQPCSLGAAAMRPLATGPL